MIVYESQSYEMMIAWNEVCLQDYDAMVRMHDALEYAVDPFACKVITID